MMTTIILCGGIGSRLWPLSRKHLPKQFSRHLHGSSLFESTVERNRADSGSFLVASNADQSFLAAGQLTDAGISNYRMLVEPLGRNTAPAIALACLMLPPEEIVLVTPSDHVIRNSAAYRMVLVEAKALAAGGSLVTFGIKPEWPETGYGYIEVQGNKVRSFKEKPDAALAGRYVESGLYYWNSGMFCFKAGTFLAELEKHAPAVAAAARTAYDNAVATAGKQAGVARAAHGGLIRLAPSLEDMAAIPSISIDYAVMEKSANVLCVTCPAELGWSDLGSHDALHQMLKDEGEAVTDESGSLRGELAGNTVAVASEPVLVDATNNMIVSQRQVALIDVQDLLVLDTPDALMICKKGSSQKVKAVVEELARREAPTADFFPTVERPWGSYTVLNEAEGYKVKRIEVRAGQRLSLQRHKQREEHWTVVEGEPHIQIGEETRQYKIGDTVFIPKQAQHRLQNSGSGRVTVIETQLGTYLGEDDIERLQDDYQRG